MTCKSTRDETKLVIDSRTALYPAWVWSKPSGKQVGGMFLLYVSKLGEPPSRSICFSGCVRARAIAVALFRCLGAKTWQGQHVLIQLATTTETKGAEPSLWTMLQQGGRLLAPTSASNGRRRGKEGERGYVSQERKDKIEGERGRGICERNGVSGEV